MGRHRLVLGTRNKKKRREIEELLAIEALELVTLDAFPNAPEPVEDAATFLGNAEKKAITHALALHEWVLGEDSGLCVDALDGRPGIFSARFAGEPCDDERNNDLLLRELESVPDAERTAYYVCAAVLVDPSGRVRANAEGRCPGRILRERRGTGGFGYDPLFWVESEKKTFGELPASFKQQHSHRAAALNELRPRLIGLLERWGEVENLRKILLP